MSWALAIFSERGHAAWRSRHATECSDSTLIAARSFDDLATRRCHDGFIERSENDRWPNTNTSP
ncbi:hypothetical protein H074_07391 [Amycolatopsis decaplanina DSM 44594]|uniref:Uncharacterized protein n=1 Tax=Amycolatopsis decaplanina DSM 44594 TaxID=1284240 RepID=M2XP33_9PSEU|nr:hypothetical protein H074_07391 [Amycolatopsis decaplanina DSM 44594]